jgi:hypothetical protein
MKATQTTITIQTPSEACLAVKKPRGWPSSSGKQMSTGAFLRGELERPEGRRHGPLGCGCEQCQRKAKPKLTVDIYYYPPPPRKPKRKRR